ncbi:zf-HC2 domain-containing protein [Streptomyces sp. NPDC002490]|uniref:zf-HC2 domain-containing protein n=1 Tax=Streptomyces sp. NPDC002490 TaxID=3154416 RepID=UPI0033182C8B
MSTPPGHRPPPAPTVPPDPAEPVSHKVLTSLLGAWALDACSAAEVAAVERHLGECGPCAVEALRLRDAVTLLHPAEPLDLDPRLRTRVLDSCLGRRPPRVPVPAWATPYDAEAARLDALLQDFGPAEWHTPVRLRWHEDAGPRSRATTVAGVIAHLWTVDGLVAAALGLTDPLAGAAEDGGPLAAGPTARTEAYWRTLAAPPDRTVRGPWREQGHALVRGAAFAADGTVPGGPAEEVPVPYGDFTLPLREAMLDRAFECWVHATDIAEAVTYPYEPPAPRHLRQLVALGVRVLPRSLARRRRAGLGPGAEPSGRPGAPARSVRLEIEGFGGGDWHIPLDPPGGADPAVHVVAHVALDDTEFCRLAAGHVAPEEAAAGREGDRRAIQEVLAATASLSRL